MAARKLSVKEQPAYYLQEEEEEGGGGGKDQRSEFTLTSFILAHASAETEYCWFGRQRGSRNRNEKAVNSNSDM